MRKCKFCSVHQEVEKFANAGIIKGKQYYRHVCKACYNKQKATYKQRQIEKIKKYKSNLSCEKCGYDDPRALVFHHKNPEDKRFSLGEAKGTGLSFETLLEEIKKCQVFCSNCHMILHHEERQP